MRKDTHNIFYVQYTFLNYEISNPIVNGSIFSGSNNNEYLVLS